MKNKKIRSLKKDVALVAGAALATTVTGTVIHQVNVHADTINTAQTPAVQNNASQEAALQSANAQDQRQIATIRQNAADVKAQHASEIAQVQQQGRANYQSQADQVNSEYSQKIAAQSQANQKAEAQTSQANQSQLASAQQAQKNAVAHANEVKSAAQAAYDQAVAKAKSAQTIQTKQANNVYTQGQQQAQAVQMKAKNQGQTNYSQAVNQAQTNKTQATSQAQAAYDQAVKAENQTYNSTKDNAQASHDNAIKDVQAKITQDQNNINAKQNAYDQAVKNAPVVNHGGVKPVQEWHWKDANNTRNDYTDVITSINQLSLQPIGLTNYKPDRDNSEAVANTGLSKEQYAKLNEYGIALINEELKKNGLQPVVASQEILNTIAKCNKYIYDTDDLNNYLRSATTSNEYPNGLHGSFYMSTTSNSMGNQTTEKASLLSFASHLNTEIYGELNGSAGLINTIKRMEANGEHVFVNFYYIDKGIVHNNGYTSIDNDPIIIIGTNDVINEDTGTITNNASTPLTNTGFVDSIRKAQAGEATPDLNAPAVKQAKQALDNAKHQLSVDQQALTKLQTGATNPAQQAEANHNNKLASLKSAYDQAIKHADDIYNQAVSQAKQILNDANTKADKTYNDALSALKKTHDDKINSINQAYTKAVNDAKITRDLEFKKADGDPNYLTDLKTQLQNKLNDQIKADQAKIDALKQERDAKLAELKKTNDTKTNDAIQAILAKYGVSDAQVQTQIAPLLADIQANKAKLAQLQHEDAVAMQNAISHQTTGTNIQLSGKATVVLPSAQGSISEGNGTANGHELPQTGDVASSLALIGLAFSSLLGLGLTKKREY